MLPDGIRRVTESSGLRLGPWQIMLVPGDPRPGPLAGAATLAPPSPPGLVAHATGSTVTGFRGTGTDSDVTGPPGPTQSDGRRLPARRLARFSCASALRARRLGPQCAARIILLNSPYGPAGGAYSCAPDLLRVDPTDPQAQASVTPAVPRSPLCSLRFSPAAAPRVSGRGPPSQSRLRLSLRHESALV